MLYKHTYYVTDVIYISIIYRVLKENLGERVERNGGEMKGSRENCIAQLKTNIKKNNLTTDKEF